MFQKACFILAAGFLVQICLAGVGWSYSTDELVGKAVNATSSLARGDVPTAASQVIGGYHVPLASQSNLSLSPGYIGFQQGIKPLSASNPYLNVGSAYQAGFNPTHYSNVSQQFQMNAGNQYFSNSTTVPVPANFKRN